MEVTRQMVLEELRRVAFAEADDSAGSSLKYASKLRALEILGRPLGAFEPEKADSRVVIVDDIAPPEG